MVSLFDYTDYRRFLKDKYFELKERNPAFSYRSFNRLAGIKSSGFLKLVMDGKRNLADEGIRKIIKGFKLNEKDAQYFQQLVKFNQAQNNQDKNEYYQNLMKFSKFIEAKPLSTAQYQIFSNWYYSAILELVRIPGREKKDLNWIAGRLLPSVERKRVKKALEDLVNFNLLKKTSDGAYLRQDTMVTTEDEVKSLAVANYHVQMSELAARAVLKEQAGQREFSALTIVTSEQAFLAAKKEIQSFRKKLHSILEQQNEDAPTFVTQINLQMFKLSQEDGK